MANADDGHLIALENGVPQPFELCLEIARVVGVDNPMLEAGAEPGTDRASESVGSALWDPP